MFRFCLCWSAAVLFWLLLSLVGHHSNHSWCKELPQIVCLIMHKHPVTVYPRAEMNILVIWIFVSDDCVQICSQLLADTSFAHAQNLTQHFHTRKQTSYIWDFLWSANGCFRGWKGLTTFALQVVCQQLANDGKTIYSVPAESSMLYEAGLKSTNNLPIARHIQSESLLTSLFWKCSPTFPSALLPRLRVCSLGCA